uniref:Uncharacterized protein n=1 Tax=Onchocerca volvulus TaxID=6282 RepID=A0A8R1TX83_ONCVO
MKCSCLGRKKISADVINHYCESKAKSTADEFDDPQISLTRKQKFVLIENWKAKENEVNDERKPKRPWRCHEIHGKSDQVILISQFFINYHRKEKHIQLRVKIMTDGSLISCCRIKWMFQRDLT